MTSQLASAQPPNDAVLTIYLLGALLSMVAFWLLCTTRKTHQKKVALMMNGYGKFDHEVVKAQIITQRSRYGKILIAATLATTSLMANAEMGTVLTNLLASIGNDSSTLGWILSIYTLLPLLVILLCMSAVVYVFLKPAAAKKKIMFGRFKGHYVLDNPESPRYGTARHEYVDN
jgi:hypothetical protein